MVRRTRTGYVHILARGPPRSKTTEAHIPDRTAPQSSFVSGRGGTADALPLDGSGAPLNPDKPVRVQLSPTAFCNGSVSFSQ